MYPDFNNSFLGFIKNGKKICLFNGTIETESAVETIGGTPINEYFGEVVLPEYYLGINGNNAGEQSLSIKGGRQTPFTSNNTIRYGTSRGLNGGELVGRKIIAGIYGMKNTAIRSGMKSSLSMNIGLLHVDGTITYIGIIDFGTIRNDNFAQNTVIEFPQRLKTLSGDGVLAQAGDRIICDYSFMLGSEISGGSYDGTSMLLDFGFVYTNNDIVRYNPLQISIE